MRARLSPSRDVFRPGLSRRMGWLLAFAGLCCCFPLARADIQDPNKPHGKGAREQRREPPANGVPQTETIDQGGRVEIILHSQGQIGKWVDFLIRSQPAHGSLLGRPRQLTRNTASVIYVHHADDGPGTDSFTYSVQVDGTAVSAPVPITIEIRDTAPAVVVSPAELDFGAVRVGDTSGADLVLQNQGGGEAVGRLELPAPWTVDGAADYRLTRGQQQSFHILFGPKSGRSFSETVPLQTDTGAPVHLLGTGLGRPGEPAAVAVAAVSPLSPPSAQPAPAPSPAAPPAVALAPSTPSPAAPPRLAGPNAVANVDPLQGMQVGPDPVPGAPPSVVWDNPALLTFYDSGVKQIKLRGAGRTTLDISWKPLTPAPKSYRIELRYLAIDHDQRLRVDWRPYAKADIHMGKDLCTATVRDLAPQTLQTLRVVALDFSGRVAGASATLQAFTLPASTFWRVTPLRVFVVLLLVCFGLAVRRRLDDRRLIREIDEARAASPDYLYRS
jgi:hypothetical protein